MTDNKWPPAPFDLANLKYQEWDAWWRGDTEELNQIYQGNPATHVRKGTQYSGGLVGKLSKMWWGRPIPQGENRSAIHDPLAAGICQLSADLLFSEPPTFEFPQPEQADKEKTVEGKKWVHPGQSRLDEIMGSEETQAELLKAGEYAAALGGVFLSVVWDKTLSDKVWIKAYRADCAIPSFHYGKLTSVRLWTEYRDGREVYRFLETHNPGFISYELFRGSHNDLGELVPLTEREETSRYESLRVPAEFDYATELWSHAVTVATGIDRLSIVYFPNMLPNTDWEKQGVLSNLGRSDLAGIEDQLDKFDQVVSSLVRDVDNGQGRVIVPESYLDLNKPGEGASFDPNRQFFSPVSVLGSSDTPMKPEIVQFNIRVEEHEQALDLILRRISFKTGYSPSHLAIKSSATGMKTATEIVADFSDSNRTRDKKIKYVKPALTELASVALEIDGNVFPGKGGGKYEKPTVTFPDLNQQDLEKLARIVQIGQMSESMSLRERVSTLHPDWTTDQIDDEVDAIRSESGVTDPGMVSNDPGFFSVNGS